MRAAVRAGATTVKAVRDATDACTSCKTCAPDIKALFRSGAGALLGFALTGQAVKERMALAKELPAILG